MYASHTDFTGRRMPPPDHWTPHVPLWPQLLAAVGVAGLICAAMLIALPGTSAQTIQSVTVYLHEAGHGLVGAIGEGRMSKLTVQAGEGGHATIAVPGTVHQTIAFAAGLVVPAWIAALFLAVGLTRVGLAVIPMLVGALMLVPAYLYLEADPQSTLAIYATAVGLILLGIVPMPAVIKAGAVLALCAALTHGVVLSAPYAYTEWIDAAQTIPSDARLIADRLGLDGITEVSEALLALMGLGAVVALLFAWNWLGRHWR